MTMTARGRNDVAGEYKAVLELANAVTTQLLEASKLSSTEILSLSESALRRRFKEDLNGGAIAYEAPLLEDKEPGLRFWMLQEKWWIAAIVASLAGFFSMFLLMPGRPSWILSWIPAGIAAALVLTMRIGTTGKSRAVLLMSGILLFCAVPMAIWIPMLSLTAGGRTRV
jgi:hypothetical protein